MISSVILASIIMHFTIHCTQSKVQKYKETKDDLVAAYGENGSAYVNYSEAYNEASKLARSSLENTHFHKDYSDKPTTAWILSDTGEQVKSDQRRIMRSYEGVKKPDSRLHRNRTITSNALDQMHTFFSDKAREDAYQKTEAEEHPYSVSYIFYNRKGEDLGMCSGTLVTISWVVTAAHCLVDNPVHKVKVFGGVTFNVFKPPKNLPKRSQVRTSYEFLSHPRYDPYSDDCDYDIGLIKIDPAFVSNHFLSPIPMASTAWNFKGYRKCTLTAFGTVRDERRSPDDYIRKTQTLWVQKPCDCSAFLMGQLGTGPVRRYVCMKPMRDFGICAGDSGGGLICDGELKAVVSFSYKVDNLDQCNLRGLSGSGECGDFDQLSIMQDLYPSLSWIRKNAFYLNTTLKDANGATNHRLSLIMAMCFIMIVLGHTSGKFIY